MPDYFQVERLPNGIIKFCLKDFTRKSIDEWAAYVLARDGKLHAPLRVIYDMQKQGYPTPYLLHRTTTVMQELNIPPNTRTVYLVAHQLESAFYRVLAARMPPKIGEVRIFLSEADATKWLLEPTEAPNGIEPNDG